MSEEHPTLDMVENRAANKLASRRALIAMLRHHGVKGRPGYVAPERGCSAEARAIRRLPSLASLPLVERTLVERIAPAPEAEIVATGLPEPAAWLDPPPRSVADILDRTAKAYRVSRAAMLEKRQGKSGAWLDRLALNEAIYIAWRFTGNFAAVGRAVGRDWTTVIHAVRQHEKRIGLVDGAEDTE